MSKSAVVIMLLSTVAAPGALAQQMFKVIGPDGKVTFSDRPALNSPGKISVMHSYTLRPYVAQRTPAELAAAEAARKATAAIPLVAGAEPVAPVLTPEVEDAVVTVMGQVEFARRFYSFCNGNLASAKAFNAATLAWKQRNAGPIGHQNRLLMQVVSPSKRDELQGKVAAMLAEEGAKVAARNPKERQAWCAGAIAELNSGKADIVQPAMMAVPIVNYRAK
jgi:hypothetical protein